MQSRPWDRDTDYSTLTKWWTDWEFGVVPKECLPPDGVIVEVDGEPVCVWVGVCVRACECACVCV